jgi:hypothetical protein
LSFVVYVGRACRIQVVGHPYHMVIRPRAILLAILLLAPRVAVADCPPVTPVACPNCFAVFVMPDTQNYTTLANQPAAANHLDLVTRYICRERTAWTEPSTGKQMPISMVIHLGDIVQNGDLEEAVAGPLAQWQRASAAFDNLDSCDAVVPYLVTNGNHDHDWTGCVIGGDPYSGCYENPTEGYETYFGADRWESQGYGCAAPDDCDWQAGEWFLGSGDEIAAGSRNNVGEGSPGPPVAQQGRHRAGLIRTPSGRPMLFLGLEMAVDFPPAAPGFEGVEGDDTRWVKEILELYPDVPTVVFHHSLFWVFDPPDTRLRWGPETWHSDSIRDILPEPEWGTERGMKDLFDYLLAPYAQVRFIFTGHVLVPTTQADHTIPRVGMPPVWGMLRNFQQVELGLPGDEDIYGVGWNVIAVFDPDAEQVRIRSYRIDDEEAYTDPPVDYLHVGEPASTECFDTDQNGFPERVISWDFDLPRVQMPSLSFVGVGLLAAGVLFTAVWVLGRRMRQRSV